MKQIRAWAIAVLLVASIGIGAFALRPHTAHASAQYIECSSTFWRDQVDSGVYTTSDGTNFRAHLYSLRDSVNAAYCGQLRVRTAWNMPITVCHTFTSQLYLSNGTLLGSTTSPRHCGDTSSWDFIKSQSSGTVFGISDCEFSGATSTPNWTVS